MNRISKQLLKIAREINASVLSNYYDNKIQKNKSALIKTFQDILTHGKLMTKSSNFKITQIYDILTDSLNIIEDKTWVNPSTYDQYDKIIKKMDPINDNNWANFVLKMSAEDYEYHTGNSDTTYNIYYTFEFKELTDVNNFIHFIRDIKDEMEHLTLATGDLPYFSFKTHNRLDMLITHNDTFKVFYYDKQRGRELQSYFDRAINNHHLNKVSRPYYTGADIKENINALNDFFGKKITKQEYDAIRDNEGSFGQRLSKNISNHIIKGIVDGKKEHPNLTSQDCYQWVKKNFLTFVQYYANKLV